MPTLGTASLVTGVVAMVLLTAVVVFGVLVNRQGRLPGLPGYAGLSLHRFLSLLAVGFLAVHIVTAVADPFAGIRLAAAIIPLASASKPVWIGLGAVSFDLMAALILTSLLRRHIGRRSWRAVHWLAYACWPAALAHSIGSNSDMSSGRLLDLTAGCILAVLAAAGWRLTGTLRAVPRARRVPELMAALDLMTAPELIAAPEPAAAGEELSRQVAGEPSDHRSHGG
jgi:sulfoxide reductase heme-binding subunit YedZ